MIILGQAQINIALSILLIILFGHAYFNMNRKKQPTCYICGLWH